MRFSLKPSLRAHQRSSSELPDSPLPQHPDLPLGLGPLPSSPRRRRESKGKGDSRRIGAGDRRSIAVIPSRPPSNLREPASSEADTTVPFNPDDDAAPTAFDPRLYSGHSRSIAASEPTSPLWWPGDERSGLDGGSASGVRDIAEDPRQAFVAQPQPQQQRVPLSSGTMAAGKTSSESGPTSIRERWTQRSLNRLNTEQSFRDQRQQHSADATTPTSSNYSVGTDGEDRSLGGRTESWERAAAGVKPQPPSALAYQGARGLQHQHHHHHHHHQQIPRDTTPAPAAEPHISHLQHHWLPTVSSPSPSHPAAPPLDRIDRPPLHTVRSEPSYHHLRGASASSASAELAASQQPLLSSPKQQTRGDRHNMQNGAGSREATLSALNGSAATGPQASSGAAAPRDPTPQGMPASDELSKDAIKQLIRDHQELREKYTKVKKYYFEKEDQVKNLQNSLAHQRLSQSRTSLDDSEYATRFNRLDGLLANLAFNIRKDWRSVPVWMAASVNRDAVATGKQEMTAVGRAFVAAWLVDELFDRHFHPSLDPSLSTQLRSIQRSIRLSAPPPQTAEEEEALTTKVVNWRLATLEGLADALRAPQQSAANRTALIDTLHAQLCSAMAAHLTDPPPPELAGGVHMIVELAVSIALHLPLESRDLAVEYFAPGRPVLSDHMRLDGGSIAPLVVSVADDDEAAERTSTRSATSDAADSAAAPPDPAEGMHAKKRGMLSALTGGGSSSSPSSKAKSAVDARNSPTGKHGNSSGSLARPDSAQGAREAAQQQQQHQHIVPRVRLAAGLAVSVRGRGVLVKAPVFATS